MISSTFLLTIAGKSALDLEATPQPHYQYLHRPGQFTIQQYFESSLFPLLNNIYIQWYHNGTAVDESRTNSSLEMHRERFTLSLTVFNATEEMDLGLYEGVVTVDCREGRPGYYICSYIGLYRLQLVSLPVILQYGKLYLLILQYGKLYLLILQYGKLYILILQYGKLYLLFLIGKQWRCFLVSKHSELVTIDSK